MCASASPRVVAIQGAPRVDLELQAGKRNAASVSRKAHPVTIVCGVRPGGLITERARWRRAAVTAKFRRGNVALCGRAKSKELNDHLGARGPAPVGLLLRMIGNWQDGGCVQQRS